jgi:crotonobetainyl-CoA:carnitine CoA-transferase CaiB-like acyl-CoA transferase
VGDPAAAEEGGDVVAGTGGVDVFVTNLLGHRQRTFGLDPDALLQACPRLVHATLTGYGVEGPDAARAGYDITAFFGRGGIAHSITEPGTHAPRSRPAQGDHTAALALLAGVLSALRLVERTGQGQVVDCSLLASAAWTMTTDLSATLVDGQNPVTRGRRHRRYALQESFRTADDRFLLLFMPEPRWWPRFCEAVGREQWLEDRRFASHATRGDHMPELTELMDALFAERTLAQWAALFEEQGFIWAPAATVAELAADEHAAATGMFPALEHPEAGTFRTVGAPFRIRGADVVPRGPAPALGEHTAAVLREAGLGDDEVRTLVDRGVVG